MIIPELIPRYVLLIPYPDRRYRRNIRIYRQMGVQQLMIQE
jgi:hypothetical protein